MSHSHSTSSREPSEAALLVTDARKLCPLTSTEISLTFSVVGRFDGSSFVAEIFLTETWLEGMMKADNGCDNKFER